MQFCVVHTHTTHYNNKQKIKKEFDGTCSVVFFPYCHWFFMVMIAVCITHTGLFSFDHFIGRRKQWIAYLSCTKQMTKFSQCHWILRMGQRTTFGHGLDIYWNIHLPEWTFYSCNIENCWNNMLDIGRFNTHSFPVRNP